jgi:predicted CXXCH cytochrome family protein
LKGGHAATACADCHKGDTFEKVSTAAYHFTSTTCTSCHEDPHREDAATNAKRGCDSCHNVRTWKDTAAFDHATTKFELLGAHRSVGCLECHRPITTQGPKTIPFKDTTVACSGCHEDIHGGQFKRDGVLPDCTTCHNLVAWKPSVFDHEKQSNFSLKGAHDRVPCGDCHTQKAMLAGHEAIVFKNAPKRCNDCHAGK